MISFELITNSRQTNLDIKKITQTLASKEFKLFDKKDSKASLKLTDDKEIKELNNKFRNINKATNVLSFPNETDLNLEDEIYLGDIIISLETIEKEAKEQNKEFITHLNHMIIHGTLHLIGFDHIEKNEAEKMEKLEISILKKLGYKNPYQIS